jgi:ATP-dependent Lon protease
LIDQTQNDLYQDRYFSGINLDLSKALFIFSYNDPEQIDKILLDRIHRIKFDNLTLDEKMTICNKYLIPEINAKMGFEDTVQLDDEIISHIIETYTCEPGVRKLKEILFDLFGEINIEILKCTNETIKIPIVITKEVLQNKYLKKYKEIKYNKIHELDTIGVINGLWANSLGMGGVLPIEAMFYPSETFLDLKLTGLQGDVMKESMNVAKTLAWSLTNIETKQKLIKQFEETKCQGIHVHCPEGAVSKDGPSAGAAITTVMYSLFNNKNEILCNQMFIDEAFVNFDKYNLSMVPQFLKSLLLYFNNIIVVSHIDLIQDNIDEITEIKYNKISGVSEMTYNSQKRTITKKTKK